MFNKTKIIENLRLQQEWAKNIDPEKIDQLLIPLNQENSLFILETPEEDYGLLIKEKNGDLELNLIPGAELFYYNEKITINMPQVFRFLDLCG